MDFLKSAVASAIAKGSSLPFSLGERVDIGDSIWTLHNGTKRVGLFLAFYLAASSPLADGTLIVMLGGRFDM